MTDKSNINVAALILHTLPIILILILNDLLAPTWFEDYINPIEALTDSEYIIGVTIFSIPFFFIIALWFKSLFNTIIPKIFNFREINYWEAYGMILLISFMNAS
mgnify:CR=1 FL=1